jgi:hypothetical protein
VHRSPAHLTFRRLSWIYHRDDNPGFAIKKFNESPVPFALAAARFTYPICAHSVVRSRRKEALAWGGKELSSWVHMVSDVLSFLAIGGLVIVRLLMDEQPGSARRN